MPFHSQIPNVHNVLAYAFPKKTKTKPDKKRED